MKNLINIDVDTDRQQVVLIGKPPEIPQPTNPEEAGKMIMVDISCVCEALLTLIQIADTNGYCKKEDTIKTSIKYLNDLLVEIKVVEEPQTVAMDKAIAIIESCTSCEHFEKASNYLELYLKSTSDQDGYNDLIKLFNEKKIELKCFEPL